MFLQKRNCDLLEEDEGYCIEVNNYDKKITDINSHFFYHPGIQRLGVDIYLINLHF